MKFIKLTGLRHTHQVNVQNIAYYTDDVSSYYEPKEIKAIVYLTGMEKKLLVRESILEIEALINPTPTSSTSNEVDDDDSLSNFLLDQSFESNNPLRYSGPY